MEIVTTKERFLQKKEEFKTELTRLNESKDKNGVVDCIQDLLDYVFGEEYKGQFSESEVHILNSMMKTFGLKAESFLKSGTEIRVLTKSENANPFINKRNLGALAGLGVGIVLAALIIDGAKPLLCGLTIGAATIAGGLISNKKPLKVSIAKQAELINVNDVVREVETTCDKIDSFMQVCHNQMEKLRD